MLINYLIYQPYYRNESYLYSLPYASYGGDDMNERAESLNLLNPKGFTYTSSFDGREIGITYDMVNPVECNCMYFEVPFQLPYSVYNFITSQASPEKISDVNALKVLQLFDTTYPLITLDSVLQWDGTSPIESYMYYSITNWFLGYAVKLPMYNYPINTKLSYVNNKDWGIIKNRKHTTEVEYSWTFYEDEYYANIMRFLQYHQNINNAFILMVYDEAEDAIIDTKRILLKNNNVNISKDKYDIYSFSLGGYIL